MRRTRPPFRIGVIALIAIVVAVYFAFSREVPFRDHYEIQATFKSANNVKPRQPVRIAGVDVGEVTKIEHPQPGREMAVITMRIKDEGRPIHEDAEVKIRPRLFLEGNWFLDIRPGTDAAGELADGGTIPIQQTATPVQLGQLLSILRSDTRQNIRSIFREYAKAVAPEGADGYRRSIRYWEPAYRNAAIVQDATLGLEEGDLSGYVDSAGRVARGLDRDPEQLKSLITDFNTAAAAFARESDPLERAIAELPRTLRAGRPALSALNDSLPPLRRLAVDLRPSIRETGRTIPVSFPFLRQTRRLVSKAELRGLVSDLVPTVPALARLNRNTIPLYRELRASAGCETEFIDPFANDRIQDPDFPAQGKVFEEAPKGLPGLAGESRSTDANGPYVHVLASAGDRTVTLGGGLFAQVYSPILGTNPPRPAGRPPLRPEVPCETQEPPDLRSRPGPPAEREVSQGLPNTPEAKARYELGKLRAIKWLERQLEIDGLDDRFDVSPEEVAP